MDKEEVFKKIKGNDKISSLPQSICEVLSALRENNVSAEKIASIIKKDIALTTKILLIANSPFYRRSKEISTVSSAVMLLGMRAVQALALSVAVYDLFKDNDENKLNPKIFWKHSIEIAILSRNLAQKLSYPVEEEAFVAGLLHDVGMLVMENTFPEEYREVLGKTHNGMSLPDAEREIFGCSHAEAAGFLAERWNLPEVLREALANHHSKQSFDTKPNGRLDQIIYIADKLGSHPFEYSPTSIVENRRECMEALKKYGVEQDEVEDILSSQLDEVIETAKYLDIDIGSPVELLGSANEMLYNLYMNIDNLLREQSAIKEKLIEEEKRKSSIRSMRILLATLSHYINNATAAILGRAQLLELSIAKGDLIDTNGSGEISLKIIQRSVDSITAVLSELKVLENFDTVRYFENSMILDIEGKLRRRLKELEKIR